MTSTQDGVRAAIAALEAQRGAIDDLTLEAALAPLRAALADAAVPTATPADEPAIRHLTVMFADVVGSTSAGQQLDAEDFHELMDTALRRFSEVVVERGGRVLKYLGDGMLAAFGLSKAREDDAERAVHAGLDLLTTASELGNSPLARSAGFAVRVGIDTGVAIVGGGVEGETSIRGHAVNLAARMEQSAPPGGLRIGRATYQLVRGLFETAEEPATIVKGVSEPIVTYLVTGRLSTSGSSQHPSSGQTPLIGRSAEWSVLVDAVDRVRASEGMRVVLLEAEAGVGKSRLVAEFASWAAGAFGRGAVLQARAQPGSVSQPYSLLRELLLRHVGFHDHVNAGPHRELLISELRGLPLAFGSPELLAHLAGFDVSDDERVKALSADPQGLRTRAHEVVAEWMECLAGTGPLVVVLDDLHWSDAATLELVTSLAQRHRHLPVLLLCATRPSLHHGRPGWVASIDGLESLRLAPFAPADSALLAQALLGMSAELPAEIRAAIDHADGNPYFVSEIVRALVDDSVVARAADGSWTIDASRLQTIRRPTTLQALLQVRVDLLDAPRRAALQQASVVGYHFWDRALAAIAPESVALLDALADAAYVVEQQHSPFFDAVEWAFQHHLLQQFVYESVLRRDRAEYHGRIGRWLAARSAESGIDLAGVIAEHYERAGWRSDAADCFAQAATNAARRGASSNAIEFVARGLALVDDDVERQWTLRSTQEELCFRLGDRDGQDAEIVALATLAERMGDPARQAETAFLLASSWFAKAEMIEAAETAHRAATQAAAIGDRRLQARALLLESSARRQAGALVAACAAGNEAVTLARTLDDRGIEASALCAWSCALAESGQLSAARVAVLHAVQLERADDTPHGLADALNCAGFVAAALGDYDTATVELTESHRIAVDTGYRFVEKCALKNLSNVMLLIGEPDEALMLATDAAAGSSMIGARDIEAAARLTMGYALLELDRWDEAGVALRLSRDLHATIGADHCAAEADAGLAELARRRGDLVTAMALVERVMVFVDAGGSFDGGTEPFRPPLACWEVLQQANDQRAAGWLAATSDDLTRRAALIDDADARLRYLHAVPHHRVIGEHARRVLPAHHRPGKAREQRDLRG